MAYSGATPKPATKFSAETTINALVSLSAPKAGITAEHLLHIIASSPDPETAKHNVASCFADTSEALGRKWANLIANLWAQHHPRVPLLNELPLTSEDVSAAPILRDALCLLAEIAVAPAAIHKEAAHTYVTPDESLRLALVMPSWPGMPFMSVEHESAIPGLYRLRLLLQAVGLLRIHQGQLKVVQTRYQAFLSLPPTHQYYILWHTEMYHVAWSEFAGLWSRYIEIIQGYLPLLWELHAEITAASPESASDWVDSVIDAFTPIWEQEGLHDSHSSSIVAMYQQAALPSVIEKLLVQDIMVRFGLLKGEDPELAAFLGNPTAAEPGHYMWTNIAQTVFAAEHHHDLPCGVDMLKEMNHHHS